MSETIVYEDTEDFARAMDEADELASFRERFAIPPSPAHSDGRPSLYMCGNSLGCQPRSVPGEMNKHLDAWANLGVEGHFKAHEAWYPYHEFVREDMARVVGARPREVVAMNTLTVNLHMLMTSFYRPTRERYRIMIDTPCFPSDVYAVKSQARLHGLDPDDAIIMLRPEPGESTLDESRIEQAIAEQGERLALVMFAGVNYFTGQRYDHARLVKAAHGVGSQIGIDCAHAAGNVALRLHDNGPDFACWCTYKYLNSGPGAVGGAFVHERHLDRDDFDAMPRFEGWWGNDPDDRFRMGEDFTPVRSADAWALSNPPIFSLVPVRESLKLFSEAGMDRLRTKSKRLTAYLAWLIERIGRASFEVVTPSEPQRRGCQLSVLVKGDRPRGLLEHLHAEGVVCDFREPNVVRLAPTPLYNTFEECRRVALVLRRFAES